MKRLLGPIVAILYMSGCRAPAPPNDPFLYRSTVPPPGTITPPPAGTPYYSAPAAIPGAAAPAISPGTPITPAPGPLTPVPAPAAPPSKYSPPGGFNYQSSLRPPAAAPAPPAGASPAPVAPTGGSSVIAAGSWQSPKDTRSESPLANQPSAQPRPDPSIVRIVEPAIAAPATAAATATAANAPTDVLQPASTTPTTLPATVQASATAMPATTSTASVTASAQPQTLDRPAIQELTDLPAVGASSQSGAKSPTNTVQATGQMSDRAMQVAAQAPDRATPVNSPGEQPGTTYGYDPDYKTLRGKLEYSVAARRWKLIYLSPDGPIDEYGGSVILPDPGQLNGFEAGDFVTVQGTFTPPTAGGGVPMFAIQRIKRQ
jgi:hypothetical protein